MLIYEAYIQNKSTNYRVSIVGFYQGFSTGQRFSNWLDKMHELLRSAGDSSSLIITKKCDEKGYDSSSSSSS